VLIVAGIGTRRP